MTDNTHANKDEISSDYVAPALVVLGTIAEVTLGTGTQEGVADAAGISII